MRLLDWDLATLVAPTGPPIRRTERVAPVAISTSPAGRAIVDFGQNLVGRMRLTVQGQAGQTITIRHAEVLEDGELCTRPLRTAKATDRYTLRGDEKESWEPRFTYHGFRCAELTGWPGKLQAEDICAVVCHSDLERTGWFECSDPLINRFHENVVWSMRGNFLDIPTDCPQRDELLGWTGDIQVFAPTPISVPPPTLPGQQNCSEGQRVSLDEMRKQSTTAYWPPRFGTHSAPNMSLHTGAFSAIPQRPMHLPFNLRFFLMRSNVGMLACVWAAIIRENGYHISTGFVGTPLLCDALCRVGEYGVAFRLLTQREYPSLLYPVTIGATTIWERWDGQLPDGSINPGEMTSFNHYALGVVADWLHRAVAGFALAAPGYRRLDIRPHLGGGLTAARARHRTPYGMAEVAWQREAGQITVEVVIPSNTTASVVLPGTEEPPLEVGAGTHRWSYPYQLSEAPQQPARSLSSPLGEVLKTPGAFQRIVGILHQHMPEVAAHMEAEAHIRWNRNRTLREVLLLIPHADIVLADLEAALMALHTQNGPAQEERSQVH